MSGGIELYVHNNIITVSFLSALGPALVFKVSGAGALGFSTRLTAEKFAWR